MGAKRQIVVWEHKHNKRPGKTNAISRIWGCFRTQKKKTLSELKLVRDQDQDLGMFWEHKQKYLSGDTNTKLVMGTKIRITWFGNTNTDISVWGCSGNTNIKVGLGIKIRIVWSGTHIQISGSGAV